MTLERHAKAILDVDFSKDGAKLATANYDQTIKLWDTRSGTELKTLAGHHSAVTCVAFNPDGTCLASGSRDSSIKLWDVQSGSERKTLVRYPHPSFEVCHG